MKKFKKLLISIISIVLAFSISLSVGFACGDGDGGEDDGLVTFEGTHIYNATDMDVDFLKNGKTNYTLVLPAGASDNVTIAKREFITFFKEATGSNIAATIDTGLTHSATQKYISIGPTELLASVSDQISREYSRLGDDGFRIVTIDNNVYITGAESDILKYGSYGNIYGVYKFLNFMFNYEYVFVDAWQIDKNVKNLKMKDFDVTDIPDIPFRCPQVGYASAHKSVTVTGENRLLSGIRYAAPDGYYKEYGGPPKYVKNSDGTYPVGTTGHWAGKTLPSTSTVSIHNDMDIIDPNVYKADHPSWFSAGGDICFTCGKAGTEAQIAAEFEALCQEVAWRCFEGFIACRPENHWKNTAVTRKLRYISVTIEDGIQGCPCAKCKEYAQIYGENASATIIFINRVCEILYGDILAQEKAKCEADPNYSFYYEPEGVSVRYEDYFDEDILITFFAYSFLSNAPAVQDESGNWVGTAPEMYLHEKAIPWVAIQNGLSQDFYSGAKAKEQFKDRIAGWAELSQNGYLYYGYSSGWQNAMLPYSYMGSYTNDYFMYHAKMGSKQHLESSVWSNVKNYTVPQFMTLQFYMIHKLSWDSSRDYQELLDIYFNTMFGDAADTMYQMYVKEREYLYYAWTQEGFSTAAQIRPAQWSYFVALEWAELAEKALTEIAHYEATDPELYESYRNHINTEWLTPAYIILYMFKSNLNQIESNAMKQKFIQVVSDLELGGGNVAQGTSANYNSFIATL